ncbi:MAG: hypothetical protein JWO21_1543, partial [Solirubrobacterales bacterium]|nr:hypothetical protein [Solirubrobacterales bacterium]
MPATVSEKKPKKAAKAKRPVEVQRASGAPAPSGERHQNEGHGRRLTIA